MTNELKLLKLHCRQLFWRLLNCRTSHLASFLNWTELNKSKTGLVRSTNFLMLTWGQGWNKTVETISSQIGSLEPDLQIFKVSDKIWCASFVCLSFLLSSLFTSRSLYISSSATQIILRVSVRLICLTISRLILSFTYVTNFPYEKQLTSKDRLKYHEIWNLWWKWLS